MKSSFKTIEKFWRSEEPAKGSGIERILYTPAEELRKEVPEAAEVRLTVLMGSCAVPEPLAYSRFFETA
jgi:hypothetical protein